MGASVLEEHKVEAVGLRWTVMQDPEGNEFCLSRPLGPS